MWSYFTTSASRLQNTLTPKHTNPNLRQAQTSENPSANPSAETPEHSHTQTYKPQPKTSANIRKPMGKPISGDKCISSAAENPLVTENSCPLIGNLSLKTSLEFHLFFLTMFWVLCANQTQIVQSPTQICSSSILRRCSSSSDCSSLPRQIVSLFFVVKLLVLLQFYCCLSTKIES